MVENITSLLYVITVTILKSLGGKPVERTLIYTQLQYGWRDHASNWSVNFDEWLVLNVIYQEMKI